MTAPLQAANRFSDEYDKDGHCRQQECGLDIVSHVYVDATALASDAPINSRGRRGASKRLGRAIQDI
jgi:hypothetical protein